MSDGGTLRIEAELAASPELVFAHFVEPERLTAWWPEVAETDPRVGGRYELSWPGPGWVLTGEYTTVVPGEHLGFTWSFAHEEGAPSHVDLRLTPTDTGCTLTIDHTWTDPDERNGYEAGWHHFLDRLRTVLG